MSHEETSTDPPAPTEIEVGATEGDLRYWRAAFTARDSAGIAGAACTGVVLFGAAIIGIHAVRPRDWAMVGYDPEVITSDQLGSELEVLESIAAGLSPGIQANNRRRNGMGRMLRWVGWMLIAAPAFGTAAYWAAYPLILPAGAAILQFPSALA